MDKGLLFLCLIVLILLFSGCTQSSESVCGNTICEVGENVTSCSQDCSEQNGDTRNFLVGTAPIPRNFPNSDAADWQDALDKISEVGDAVNAADGTWRPLINGFDNSLIGFAAGTTTVHKATPIYSISYFNQEEITNTGELQIDWSSVEDKEAYKKVAVDLCKKYDAKYLGLSIENNFHYKYKPEDYDLWIEIYKDTYDTVKVACPNTKVFVTFQYEMLQGLGQKYWGEYDSQWEILEKYGGKLDLIVLTTYPELEYDTPNEIPNDYYLKIKNYTDKPIAFAEVGWNNDNGDFLNKFLDLTKDLDKEFVMWAFLHDMDVPHFTGIGLRNKDGTPKEVWADWKALRDLPYVVN